MSDLISLLDLSANNHLLLTNRDFISQPFVFHLLLQDLSKKDKHLLLVLLAHNWSHYRTIAAKCGLNLNHLKDKSLIRVIDVLSQEYFDFHKFVSEINEEIKELPPNSVILIDDLSLIFSLNVHFLDIYKLVHNLRVNCLQNNSILTIGTHFPTEEEDEDIYRLVVTIAHECDIWCELNKTRTGYSPLISGTLKIHKSYDNSVKEFNYKLGDRSVKLLPLGSDIL